MKSYKELLNHVNTFIFDVDGVLTNGDVIIFNDDVIRTLNSRDSYAIQYAVKQGFEVYVITGGNSQDVRNRLLELGVKEVHLRSSNKIDVLNDIVQRNGLSKEHILYMGDDIPDYEVMQSVGVAACPQDAAIEIKRISHYQSPFNGGRHCVRDVIEQTLRVQNKWFANGAFHW